MSLDISKVHNDAILEYIYNKLDEEQLYYPFIDLEFEKRIKHLCEDVYEAGYRDGQETEKLKKKENKNIFTLDMDIQKTAKLEDIFDNMLDNICSELGLGAKLL